MNGCFAYFVFLVSRDCCLALPRGAMGLSAACDCGISRSYSPFSIPLLQMSRLLFLTFTQQTYSFYSLSSSFRRGVTGGMQG